jgi:arginine/serine-rich splicing factor 4/5/6
MSRIYIGRLSYNAREKDVDRFFRGFGRIRDINLKNGFGFVVSEILVGVFLGCLCLPFCLDFLGYHFPFQEFDDPRDADDAVYELNGRELLGER